MTVQGLLESITSRELSEWQAFYNIEPFGEFREDLRFGLMTANLMQPHLRKGCRAKVEDFILKFSKKKSKRMSDADLMKALRMACGKGR